MSALPPALRPWASQLSLFPDDLALHLGPYVARLSAALGSLRPRGEADGGEPQGYDGLTRRGTFDRLLVSEWLWALESPDELVRRAAFGELSFLKPAFRQPQGARRTVALLDAGPDQLGAPRIAHLALLIVLSRRAEAAGAAFSWGVLQADPDKGTFSEVTPGTVGTWLAARDLTPATDGRLAAWRDALSLDAAPEDAWLVGDARLSRLPKAAGLSRVEVAEVLGTDARQLTVDVRPASRAARSVMLDLPPSNTCVRLLRDPFQQPRSAPVVVSKPSLPPLCGFAFSADGRRLLLRREDGSVSAMAIPHSPRATVPKARRVTPRPEELLVGMGWRYNGGMLVLTRDGKTEDFILHGTLRTASPRARPEPFPFRVRSPDVSNGLRPSHDISTRSRSLPPGRLLSYEDSQGNEHLLLTGANPLLFRDVDLQSGLFPIEDDRSARRIRLSCLALGVNAAAEVNRKVVFATHAAPGNEGKVSEDLWLCALERTSIRHIPLGRSEGRPYFGYTPTAPHSEAGLLTVCHEPGRWRLIFGKDTATDVCIPTGMRVVGASVCRDSKDEPGVLALDEDRRTLWHLTSGARHKVTVAWDDVVHAEASHSVPVLGVLMKGGALVLIHLQEGGVLYQELPGVTR